MKKWEQLKELEKAQEQLDFRVDGEMVAWFEVDGALCLRDDIEQKDLAAFVLWISKCQEEI